MYLYIGQIMKKAPVKLSTENANTANKVQNVPPVTTEVSSNVVTNNLIYPDQS